MLIVCPSCTTSYEVQPAALGDAGRSVRCARCKTTWYATAEPEVAQPVAAEVTLPDGWADEPQDQARAAAAAEAGEDLTGDFAVDRMAGEEAAPPPDAPAEAPAPILGEEPPPLAPAMEEPTQPLEPGSKFDPGAPESIETLAARRERRAQALRSRKKGWRVVLTMPVLIFALAVTVIGLLYARVAIVRYIPQTASLYAAIGMPVNLRGLVFIDVKSSSEFHEGVMVLVVQGAIANITGRNIEIPRLRFAVRNGAGHEVYAWTALPPRNLLGPGDGTPFRTRLASPPPDGRDVIVRFYNRRDAVAGTK